MALGGAPTPSAAAKPTKAPRNRPTTKASMGHSPAIIAAVFNCVKNKIGSRKAHQQLSAEHKAKCHRLKHSEIESHLKRFKKLELPRPAKGVAIPFFPCCAQPRFISASVFARARLFARARQGKEGFSDPPLRVWGRDWREVALTPGFRVPGRSPFRRRLDP